MICSQMHHSVVLRHAPRAAPRTTHHIRAPRAGTGRSISPPESVLFALLGILFARKRRLRRRTWRAAATYEGIMLGHVRLGRHGRL